MHAEPNAAIDRNALATELADRLPKQIDFDEVQLVTPAGGQSSTDHWQTQHVTRLVPADS